MIPKQYFQYIFSLFPVYFQFVIKYLCSVWENITARRSWGGIGVLACPSICLNICPSVLFGNGEIQERLMLRSWNFICGMYMKNKWTPIFSFSPSFRSYAPFSPLSFHIATTLRTKISEEPLKLGCWYLVYSHRSRCRWLEELSSLFRKVSVDYFPFLVTGILYWNKLVNRISEGPLNKGTRYLACRFGSRCRWIDYFARFRSSYWHRHFIWE